MRRWGGANTPNRFWSYTTVRQLLQIQNPLWAVADKCSWNSKHCWGWQLGAEGASLILRKEHGAIWWLHLRKYTWWILIVSLWLPAAFYASSASWLSKDRAFIHSLYKSLDSCIEICACQKQNTHTPTHTRETKIHLNFTSAHKPEVTPCHSVSGFSLCSWDSSVFLSHGRIAALPLAALHKSVLKFHDSSNWNIMRLEFY